MFIFNSYLDGATPTRFGTKPLKSPAIPSYFRIYLKNKKKFNFQILDIKRIFYTEMN